MREHRTRLAGIHGWSLTRWGTLDTLLQRPTDLLRVDVAATEVCVGRGDDVATTVHVPRIRENVPQTNWWMANRSPQSRELRRGP